MLRRSLMVLCLLFFLPLSVVSVQAADADSARRFVDEVGKKVLAVVNGQAAEAQKQQQLRQLFSEHVDMEWMGRFVLGQGWAKATEDQRARYLAAYREYLLARYTTNFADYAGSKYTITGAKAESDGQFTVGMQVNSPNAKEQEVQAGYRLRAAEGGQFKIIDIIIEGVSLITTQRSDFGAVVQKDGMDKLIEQVQAKAQANP
jgi:phospholipid transport system substrate-binding protein